MTNYKTINDILHMVNKTTYPRIARQLQMLAITEFAKEIEKKGCKIVSCHPYQIKLDNSKIVKVLGSYIEYTYDEKEYFYFQFDENPFFPPMGFRKNIQSKEVYTTGVTELNLIYEGINEYSIEEKYIKQLVQNLHKAEKYLKTTVSTIYKDKITHKDEQQRIYTN